MSTDMDRKVQRSKWTSRRAVIGAASVCAVLAALYMGWAFLGGAQRSLRVPAATVTIDTVQQGVFHDFVALRGKIAPRDTVYLDALEGGQIQQVSAQAGDTVKAGQPLLTFRNTTLELDVLDREGRLIESITELQTYEKQLEDSRLANQKAAADIDYNIIRLTRSAARRDDLADSGLIPGETREVVHDELDHYQQLQPLQDASNARQEALRLRQLPQIHTQLVTLQESLRITRAKLDDLVVKAPVAGRLTDIDKNIGENRNRGDRLGEIVPDTGFKVSADIDEFYLGRVQVGQTANADIGDRSWKLSVTRVYPQVTNGVFTVDLGFAGPTPGGLLPGQAVDGKLALGGDQPALILPAGAFLERSGGDFVMVVDRSGRHALRRRIKIGRRNAEQVEVLSGLQPGDRVITSDYTAFEKIDRVDLSQ